MIRTGSRTRCGFTLVELLTVIAILFVLGGIIYSALAPVREKARETRCLSNLHQISQAIQMYRQDYHGADPPEALTYFQLGLPLSPFSIKNAYAKSSEIWKCQSEYWGPDEPVLPAESRPISYSWFVMGDDMVQPPIPTFSKLVASRGDETPIMADQHHGGRWLTNSPSFWVLVLRLGGQVQRTKVPRNSSSWDW